MSDRALFQGGWNFLALPPELSDPQRARAWVLPVPFEATTSYGAGTREGPGAILAASRQVERYDREFNDQPARLVGIHTLSPVAMVHRSPDEMVATIEEAVTTILKGHPRPELLVVLGGEHTISAGVVRGLAQAEGVEDLVAVQVDAHGDLNDEYEHSRYSHACAARRIVETCPLFQIGIRNTTAQEEQFRRQSDRVVTIFAEEANSDRSYLSRLADFVRGKRVYLTIDLDGLDPSIMPAVGTPEPGGLSWASLMEIVRLVCREARQVPIFDVVELAPIPGMRAPDFIAADLVYKTIALILLRDRTLDQPR